MQLRAVQLVALTVQVVFLYLESDRVGLLGFIAPFTLVLCNLYIVGIRWYARIDGRFDVQQLFKVQDWFLKAQYALAIFGGFLLAVIVHFLSPEIESGMNSVFYNLGNYVSIVAGFCSAVVEVYEGVQEKKLG